MPRSISPTLRLSLVLGLSCGSPADKPESGALDFDPGGVADTGGPDPADTDTADPTDTDTDTDTADPTDTGGEEGGDSGTDSGIEDPSPLPIDGAWEGSLTVTFLTDPLGTGALLEATCTGPMVANVARDEEPQIHGSGECSIPADSALATLLGSYGPFPGRTSGSVAEDESALGVIVLEIPGVEHDILVDWTGLFKETDGTLNLNGEASGTIEDLAYLLGPAEMVFDVTYTGTFELEQIPTP
jgi:hypothetical protein